MNLTSEMFGLTLFLLPGIGRKTVRQVLIQIDEPPNSAQEILEALHAHAGKRGEKFTIVDVTPALDRADQLISESLEQGITTLSVYSPSYPDQLKATDDPPAILYVKGDLNALRPKDSIAVIGTRHPTEYAAKSAFRIASRLTKQGFVIVSGLALGCDSQAHEGCVDAEGVSVSVLAHGLDQVHPKANAGLAEKILDNGGALVSEYLVGEKPQPVYFVERDRIQSGLSSAVLVIETDVSGGTMHTVRFAKNQGRQIAVLAHPDAFSQDSKSAGNRELLTEKEVLPISDSEGLELLVRTLREPVESRLDHDTVPSPVGTQKDLWGDAQ